MEWGSGGGPGTKFKILYPELPKKLVARKRSEKSKELRSARRIAGGETASTKFKILYPELSKKMLRGDGRRRARNWNWNTALLEERRPVPSSKSYILNFQKKKLRGDGRRRARNWNWNTALLEERRPVPSSKSYILNFQKKCCAETVGEEQGIEIETPYCWRRDGQYQVQNFISWTSKKLVARRPSEKSKKLRLKHGIAGGETASIKFKILYPELPKNFLRGDGRRRARKLIQTLLCRDLQKKKTWAKIDNENRQLHCRKPRAKVKTS